MCPPSERPLHFAEKVLPILHGLGTDSYLVVKKHQSMEAMLLYLGRWWCLLGGWWCPQRWACWGLPFIWSPDGSWWCRAEPLRQRVAHGLIGGWGRLEWLPSSWDPPLGVRVHGWGSGESMATPVFPQPATWVTPSMA